MLPSSYTRRLRTKDLIKKNSLDRLPSQISKKSTQLNRVDFAGAKFTHSYLPYLHREKTQTVCYSPVSGQINKVLQRLSDIQKEEQRKDEIYQQKLKAVGWTKEPRDTPVPGHVEKQRSRLSIKSKRLHVIKESVTDITPRFDTIENLTKDRMKLLVTKLMKNKDLNRILRRNQNKIELLPPVVTEGYPAWRQNCKPELFILVPVKSIRYSKYRYNVPQTGYLQIELPRKNPKFRGTDTYAELRAVDGIHLSTSKLNKALVEIFVEGLSNANFGANDLTPKVNFDYLNDAVELVYTKQLRIHLIPAIHLSNDDPLYVTRANVPDLDPTSDTMFRACFLPQEERILQKISTTDIGHRLDALRVIHTLCKQDWRLQALSTYQLINVLMHDMDFEIDHSPRWQRVTRDMCVQSILKRLLYFVKKQTLPHFFMSDLNLFRGIPQKYLTYMRTPLERLVSNETQLLRDLKRASRDYESSNSSSSSDEDWW